MAKQRELGTYQMLWDCPYCGADKLLALDHRHCPGCGAAQNPENRYFPSDQDKVAVEDHRFVGADWHCPACDTANAAAARFCVNCGTGREDSEAVVRQPDQAVGAQEPPARKAPPPRPAAARQRRPPTGAAGSKKGGGKGKLFLLIGLAAVVLLVLALFWKKSATATVSGHTWTRSVEIERFEAVEASAWCDEMPGAAYAVTRRREKRGTEQVENGETCQTVQQDQGDGTFKEVEECTPAYKDVDVFDQKCYFSVNTWTPVRTETASGASLAETPQWPDPRLARTGAGLGAERAGQRSETYTVSFRLEDGETKDCTFSEAKWQSFAVNQRVEVKVGGLSGGLSCGSL